MRLEHFAIYLMKCKAQEKTISLAILEQVVDDIKTQEEDTWVKKSREEREWEIQGSWRVKIGWKSQDGDLVGWGVVGGDITEDRSAA